MASSGKFVLRIDPKLHSSFRKEAKERGISLNHLIVSRLTAGSKLEPVISEVRSAFGESLSGIILFGSAVRGEQTKISDIDLLIVLKSEVAISRKLYQIWDDSIALSVGEAYSPQFVHLPKDFDSISSLWLEVGLEGEILFDQSDSIRHCVSKIKQQIAEGRFVRRLSHGSPYWMRKGLIDAK